MDRSLFRFNATLLDKCLEWIIYTRAIELGSIKMGDFEVWIIDLFRFKGVYYIHAD